MRVIGEFSELWRVAESCGELRRVAESCGKQGFPEGALKRCIGDEDTRVAAGVPLINANLD